MNKQKIDNLKIPPHSFEAEQAVIGGLMLDNSVWDKVTDHLLEQDFYNKEHRLIFSVITDLSNNNKPFDILTISSNLKERNQLDEIGGEVYLFELANNIPSVANIVAYANIISDRSILRQLIQISGDIADVSFNTQGRDSRDILDEVENKVFKIAQKKSRGNEAENINSLLAGAIDHIEKLYHSESTIVGLPTGFNDFDAMTSRLQPAELIIVAGRPSVGKTAFAMNIVEYAAINTNKPILIFSMEMPGKSLALRMMSSLGRIDQTKVRTARLKENDWPRINSAISILAEAQIYVDDTPSLSPAELRSRARRIVNKHGQLGLIIVDYMQLMNVPGQKNRVLEISQISRDLKSLATELDVPLLCLSQLNRSLEQRPNKRPIMSDLRDSGSIEQDADLIAFIYRDEVYNSNSADKGIAEIIIAKQRNGPIGTIRLTFLDTYTRFENFTNTYKYN